MRNIKGFCIIALAVGIFCFGPASAGSVCAADKNPCSEDLGKFCKGVSRGGGAIMDCLEKHEKELTEACRKYEEKMKGGRVEVKERIRERVQFRKACKDDMVKYCGGADPSYDQSIKCLDKHSKDLSPWCREQVKTLK